MSESLSLLRAACEQLLQKLVSREGYATLSAPLAIAEIEAFARRQQQEGGKQALMDAADSLTHATEWVTAAWLRARAKEIDQ